MTERMCDGSEAIAAMAATEADLVAIRSGGRRICRPCA
jgi:hypothetical protein